MSPKVLEVIDSVRAAVRSAAASGDLPAFLAELEKVRVEALMAATSALAAPPRKAADRVLTVTEAAERIGRSRWWLYRNKAVLPLVRFPTGGYGISEAGLDRWIRERSES